MADHELTPEEGFLEQISFRDYIEGRQLRRSRKPLAIIDAISCEISPAYLLPSGVGLGYQSALLSIQSVAASYDSRLPILCNAAFDLTLLLLGQCGRRKCQKC
jgi:hypothetical protein